ncbi:glucose 1-dehydrogenase [Neobacillus sp. YX16]|uniref:SDR family NAD(P)-dependent oxidoreductase n=1 Tax=Neobacillus sp. YX16 TaxID=3047874 RepID=UPI0024C23E37|nr:glucose 1-dehydrogenase [Neobacillus sp. YX16]WHZ00824.1 glucose 1-dehydrogenase [Neobacillus sp. YX16]
MGKLSGKVAIITGATGEIGKGTAEKFLKEGAKLVLVDINEDAMKKAKEELELSGEIITVIADVSKESDVKNYVNTCVEHFGRIDVFFNNAGIEGKVAPLVQQNLEDFDAVMNVNVRGVFLGLKYVLPNMIAQGCGSIINSSSGAGLDASPNISPYIASKHAVVGLTKSAAIGSANANVRVNSIHPTAVDSRMMRSLEEGMGVKQETIAKGIPLGRYGTTYDIANLVLFLASDESAFITGAQYRIDGGKGAL